MARFLRRPDLLDRVSGRMAELIEIVVNGEARRVPVGTTVAGLVTDLGLSGPVAVERNREVIPRAEHTSVELAAGDRLELVTFVGGG
jgi:sulfur carrier protein